MLVSGACRCDFSDVIKDLKTEKGGLSWMVRVSPKCKHKCPHKREADVRAAGGDLPTKHDAMVPALRVAERVMSCAWLTAVGGKGKRMDPPLDLPQGMWPYHHLDFRFVKLTSNFGSPVLFENKYVLC